MKECALSTIYPLNEANCTLNELLSPKRWGKSGETPSGARDGAHLSCSQDAALWRLKGLPEAVLGIGGSWLSSGMIAVLQTKLPPFLIPSTIAILTESTQPLLLTFRLPSLPPGPASSRRSSASPYPSSHPTCQSSLTRKDNMRHLLVALRKPSQQLL